MKQPSSENALKETSGDCILLKNGFIVDGAGGNGFCGDVLIKGKSIAEISQAPIPVQCKILDCTDQVIAPGFIDAHSHMDWFLPMKDADALRSSFTAQGITTFVTGNCGFSPGGFQNNSPYKHLIGLGGHPAFDLDWDDMEGYFDLLERNGLSHNVVHLAGHGATQTSMRGFDSKPLDGRELKDLCSLLEKAMDQGAAGVSFGLGYEPGIFFPTDQIKEIARLVEKKDKIITVHGRAFTPLSTIYPERSDVPHNIISLQEMIEVSRETGVRMQYSHLIFVGEKAFSTCPQALETLDAAIAQGVDIMVDSFPYHCGQSIINVVIPPWFLANIPANYKDPKAVAAVEESLNLFGEILGFGPADIQLTFGAHPDYLDCSGLFMDEIAEKKSMSPGRVILDLSEKTGGTAPILNHRYSNMDIIDALMPHPACLFMTDAIPIGSGVENPSGYGAFPLFLQYARERGRLSLEKAVHKMTGATAQRFNFKDRGLLRKGMAADITVFDWNTIRDNNTVKKTTQGPTGIKAVFMNGELVLQDGRVDSAVKAGELLRS